MDLYISVVLYNKTIDQITSMPQFLELLSRYEQMRLLIYDNSDSNVAVQNQQLIEIEPYNYDRIFYHSNGGNKGLSISYNQAFREAQAKSQDVFWMMLSDDDTDFSIEYLENAIAEIQTSENTKTNSSTVTMVTGVIPQMSPVRKHRIKNNALTNLIDQPGQYQNIYCINSGLWINSEAWRAVGGFDETLFLDMVDYAFMYRLWEKNLNSVKVVGGTIKQSFSAEVTKDKSASKKRFQIFRKDFKTYCGITRRKPWFYGVIVTKRYIRVIM